MKDIPKLFFGGGFPLVLFSVMMKSNLFNNNKNKKKKKNDGPRTGEAHPWLIVCLISRDAFVVCEGSWKMKLFPGTFQMWPHGGSNSDSTLCPNYFKHDCEYSPLYILTKIWTKISNRYSSSIIIVSPVLAYFILFSLFSILNNGFLTATTPLRQFLMRLMKTVDEPTAGQAHC